MKFSEQMFSHLSLKSLEVVSIGKYLEEHDDLRVPITESMSGFAEEEPCCHEHLTELLVGVYVAGITAAVRAYIMYGEPDDLRELLVVVPGFEQGKKWGDDHD
jgi:hypothetical protein